MLFYTGIALLAVGILGFLIRSVEFVRVTLPQNLGSNPGFGCYETMVLPSYGAICVGAGLTVGSWKAGVILLLLGVVLLGFVAQLLARFFGRRSRGRDDAGTAYD